MTNYLSLHRKKLVLILVLASIVLIASAAFGAPKSWHDIDWVDVLGEGGSAIAMAAWMLMVLRSRPAGRVTNLLTLGLGFMFLAMWQDSLDEFFKIASTQVWEPWVESLAMPLGIGLLTYGLWHWHQEQLAIRHQLLKREQCFRDHLWLDGLHQLAGVDQLKVSLEDCWETTDEVQTLLMAELKGFSEFERTHGYTEADRLLRESAELLMLNLRTNDLICRYARDRLVIMLPQATPEYALTLADELCQAVAHFSFKLKDSGMSVPLTLYVGVAVRQQEDAPEMLIERAHQAVTQASSGSGHSLAS